MKKYGLVLAVMALVLVITVPCFAEGKDNAFTKLGNGLHNALTGWLEIPDQMYQETKKENHVGGLVYGTVKGAVYSVARTTAGAIDAGTFLFPAYDKPIMEPKYKF